MRVQLDVVQGRGAPEVLDLDAASLEDARREAGQRGYTVLAARGAQALQPHVRTRFDLPVFIEQLRDLLIAGLSVIEALSTLQAGASSAGVAVTHSLASELRGGRRLSEALASQPVFPPLLIALVRASELTSDLPQALGRYLEHEQRVAEVRHRIVSVAIYPVLVTAVGALVLLFLGLYVMPRFARVFDGMTGELPWSARAMVAWAHWLHGHQLVLLTAIGLALVVLVALLSAPAVRDHVLRRLLDSAFLRDRLRTYFLARWYRATGMLVEGGIPLPQSLSLVTSLLPTALQPAALAAERAVRDGLSPAAAYAQAGMTTPVAEQLMRAGERTGDLGAVLTRIAHFHEAEVTRSLERGMRALEPVVMTLIGIGVGAVVVLMYMPIFELAATLQ